MPRITVRVILDKNVPRPLLRLLSHHDVCTTDDLGWSTLSNGVLLSSANQAGLDVMLTCDQNIRHQNNLSRVGLGLVVLSTNAWHVIRPESGRVVQAVDAATAGSYQVVDFPLPPRPGRKPFAKV
jgi:hypothetical protein